MKRLSGQKPRHISDNLSLAYYQSDVYLKNSRLLDNAVDPKTGCWKDTAYVFKQTVLQFNGIELALYPDGTYCLGDTSGG